MKSLIFILLICLSTLSFAQVRKTGSLASPYSISGWDAPIDSTTYYKLKIFQLLTNPGGWINRNTREIDSLFNALVVFVDSLQMTIKDDTLKFSPYMSGQNAFSTTAETDTVNINGIDSLDIVTVSPREATPTANDILGVTVLTNKIVVSRPAAGTSGLKYNWIWIRKYQ
jgi:hypothetical protein